MGVIIVLGIDILRVLINRLILMIVIDGIKIGKSFFHVDVDRWKMKEKIMKFPVLIFKIGERIIIKVILIIYRFNKFEMKL